MIINNASIALFIICGFWLQSCASVRTIQSSDLLSVDQSSIDVFVKDGNVIRFNEKNFQIDSSQSEYSIVGEGYTVNINSTAAKHVLTNSISFSQIDSIQIREFSNASKGIGLAIVIVGSIAVALLILGWIIGPISIG